MLSSVRLQLILWDMWTEGNHCTFLTVFSVWMEEASYEKGGRKAIVKYNALTNNSISSLVSKSI